MTTIRILVDIRANRFAEVSTCQRPYTEATVQGFVHRARVEGFAICPGCMWNLNPDGACRSCEASYQRCSRMVERARGRLAWDWFELSQAQRDSLERVVKLHDQAWAAAERDSVTDPNGCRRCGHAERGHGLVWGHGPDGKRGPFLAPSNRLRLNRMLARRAAAQGRLYAAVDRLFFRWIGEKPVTAARLAEALLAA